MSNSLKYETSPYLLQHKNNPVNWFSWNVKNLAIAKKSSLPILLSVGYSSCHWCHVMAHESFESVEIADFLNKKFISIKVDREERPDVDSLYQSALSLMGQQGGWPLTMFLDSDLVPFWGGTYFPNVNKHGMPSFIDILSHVSNIYKKNKKQVGHNSRAIKNALDKIYFETTSTDYNLKDISSFINTINSRFDSDYGGLSGAPKFPMVPLLMSLLSVSINPTSEHPALFNNIQNTAKSICLGGIFDHVGGGFSRYSVDKYWLVPHFEKMLYDNAQLIEFLSALYLVSPSLIYKDRIEKTFNWLSSDMMLCEGGLCAYYSAMDADSEGVEGKYYVWSFDEICKVLKGDVGNFLEDFNIIKNGNWEGTNILNRINKKSDNDFYIESSKTNVQALKMLSNYRKTRIPPEIDKKILTDWNLMMVSGLLRAYVATNEKKYLTRACEVYDFVLKKHFIKEKLYHSSCNGVLGPEATLDDYANFIKASFLMYEVVGDESKIEFSQRLIELVIEKFYDKKINDFYFANKDNKDLFLNTKNTVDGATQSASGLMLQNLYRGYCFFGKEGYVKIVDDMLKNNWSGVLSAPISYVGYVHSALLKLSSYQLVIIIKNDDFGKYIKKYLLKLGCFCILNFVYDEKKITKSSPAFGKKIINGGTTVYVCRGFVCSAPITNVVEINKWLNKNTFIKV